MKVEIKDKDGTINAGLRAAGYGLDSANTETILNVIDFIRSKPEATLQDIVELNGIVKDLYQEEKQ